LPGVAAAAAGLALCATMAPSLRAQLSAVHVPGSDLYATLDWMRASLPRAVDAYDPRLLDAASLPPELSRASAVLAPWSLGHLLLFSAEQPVAANNFGYGFLDSIRFFLAESESEALALARERRARWVVATDLLARMNDYAKYLERPPLFEARPQGLAPTPRYFSTLQARLYEFDGQGGRVGDLVVEPLPSFRLIHRSQSAVRRGDRWVALWKVFEITEAGEDRTSPRPAAPSAAPPASPPPR
jgi:asparagine N-glycosylation enzyme membrane subunit Stt3